MCSRAATSRGGTTIVVLMTTIVRRQKDSLEAIAKHRDVSVAALIRKAVDSFLKKRSRK